jgi:hypothetical protein
VGGGWGLGLGGLHAGEHQKPGTWIPVPETRNLDPGTRNPQSGSRILEPETRDLDPESQHTKQATIREDSGLLLICGQLRAFQDPNIESISHRCYPILVAVILELT